MKLSEGKLESLRKHVALAKLDYRDVLAYAEYPEQIKLPVSKMRSLSPAERTAIKKRGKTIPCVVEKRLARYL